MVSLAQIFAEHEIVATLSRQLNWSHFVNLLPVKTEQARQFYASEATNQTWSVRELRQQIERKTFERIELPSLQAPTPFGLSLSKPREPAPLKSSKTLIS